MTTPLAALEALVGAELARDVDPAVLRMSDAIRAEHGGVRAVLFYGSCLRRGTTEGVLDFFVLVDSYASAYRSRRLALLNRLAPPNVFRIELPGEQPLRAKYAVISVADFVRATGPRHLHPFVWARFAQPAALVWTAEETDRVTVNRAVARAAVTMTAFATALHPAGPLTIEGCWDHAFRQTYRTELRTESAGTIGSIYAADPERYRAVFLHALGVLTAEGRLAGFTLDGDVVSVRWPRLRRALMRARWWARLPAAKALAGVRLLKGVTTFTGWLPYVLWKLERHTGVRVELSPRQRRYPLLFGWPVLFRLLTSGALR